jgi:hypothetical protein
MIRKMTVPCLDPRSVCWRCGARGTLKCVENIGWLCKSCREDQANG